MTNLSSSNGSNKLLHLKSFKNSGKSRKLYLVHGKAAVSIARVPVFFDGAAFPLKAVHKTAHNLEHLLSKVAVLYMWILGLF